MSSRLLNSSGSIDDFWWQDDNITTFCSSDCSSEIVEWDGNVHFQCSDDFLTIGSRLIPADAITGRFREGAKIACLGSTDTPDWCLVESFSWQGSDIVRPNCTQDSTKSQCQNDPANMRLANLYDDDVLCSSWSDVLQLQNHSY